MRFLFFVLFSGLRKYDYSGLLYQLIIIMLMERTIPEYTYNINSKRRYDEKVFFCCFDLLEPDFVTASFFLSYHILFVSRYTGDYDLN